MKRTIIVFLALISTALHAQNKEVFSIGSVQSTPGEKVTGKLTIEQGIDRGSFVPISIIHGEKPGPVLTLNAGIHGTEYVPVIVLQRILKEIDPAELSGILVLVQVANVPSFQGRGVYSNPIDFKNLNRVFPGKAKGTFSQRLAFILSKEIIANSDYYIDLHGGEYNESLLDYLYFTYGCADSEVCKKSKMMAMAMGNRYLIPFDANLITDSLSMYSDSEATLQGIPAIVAEFGDRGKVEHATLDFAEKGIINVMKTLGMLEGEAFVVENPIYMLEEKYLRSKHNGIFYSLFEKGHYVTKGSLLGYTTDYWGNRIEEFVAPYSGIIISTYLSPVVNIGEGVIHMAKVSDEFDEM